MSTQKKNKKMNYNVSQLTKFPNVTSFNSTPLTFTKKVLKLQYEARI